MFFVMLQENQKVDICHVTIFILWVVDNLISSDLFTI